MTVPAPVRRQRDGHEPATILLLGQEHATRALIREVLSASGYRVVEAANYQHADVIIGQFENAVDLIVGCSQSHQEASSLNEWHKRHPMTPLVVLPVGDHRLCELSAEEIATGVGVALGRIRSTTSVLIVDENASERSLIASLLETTGYRVTQAANGREALALIAHDPPDLLLTEIVMPEKDGLELINEVRRHCLKITIVAMSGTPRADGYLSIARLLGARYTLKKPLHVEQLMRVLRQAETNKD